MASVNQLPSPLMPTCRLDEIARLLWPSALLFLYCKNKPEEEEEEEEDNVSNRFSKSREPFQLQKSRCRRYWRWNGYELLLPALRSLDRSYSVSLPR